MFVPRIRAAAACLCVAAVVIVAGTASAEQEFTPVAVGVRYRKIGVFDEARLAAILDRGLDAFMAGFDPSQGGLEHDAVPAPPGDARHPGHGRGDGQRAGRPHRRIPPADHESAAAGCRVDNRQIAPEVDRRRKAGEGFDRLAQEMKVSRGTILRAYDFANRDEAAAAAREG